MKAFLFLFLAILFITGSRTLYKFSADSENFKIILFILGISLGFVHALFYTKAVTTLELSTANVVFVAGSLILVELVAIILFHENLNTQKAVGLILVLVGLVLTLVDLKSLNMHIIFILSTLFVLASIIAPAVKFVCTDHQSQSFDFPTPNHYPEKNDTNDDKDFR